MTDTSKERITAECGVLRSGDGVYRTLALADLLEALAAERNRLTQERDRFEKALARACLVGGTAYLVERAEAAEARIAEVTAAAYEAAAEACADYPRSALDESEWTRYDEQIAYAQTSIRALTPADALAALEARDNRVRAEAYKGIAKMIDAKIADYVKDYGVYDPSTGQTELPGDGDEWVGDWVETAEAIRALASQGDSNDR